MAYKPAKNYSDARVLAAAAGCTVLSGGSCSPATPAAKAAGCGFGGATEGDGLSEAMIFSSSAAEASLAGQAEQGAASDDTADYGVFGPGWAISTITTVTDAQACRFRLPLEGRSCASTRLLGTAEFYNDRRAWNSSCLPRAVAS